MLKHIQELVFKEINDTLADFANPPTGEKSSVADFTAAKQPIFDIAGNIWGYELLYRNQPNISYADISNEAQATARIITCCFETARHGLRKDQRLLVNFPADMIEVQAIKLLPKNQCILEILEGVSPTPTILTALKEIKAAGYILALDDYTGQPSLEPFLPLVDIIKLDVLNRDSQDIAALAHSLRELTCVRLAEKVENAYSKKICQEHGCVLFQGYFFSKPELIAGKNYSSSMAERMHIFSLLIEDPINITKLSNAILHMPVLTVKLLAFANSTFFSFTQNVSNVLQALRLMGTEIFTQWLCVAVIASLDHSPPSFELSFLASQRAKFLENLGMTLQELKMLPPQILPQELFLLGLFSLLEAIAKIPLEVILKDVPLEKELVNALLGGTNTYSPWLVLLDSYQRGEWEKALELAANYGLEERHLSTAWASALRWSAEFFFPQSGAPQSGTPRRSR